MQFDTPAQGLGSIGAVQEPLIAGVVADSCNNRADENVSRQEKADLTLVAS